MTGNLFLATVFLSMTFLPIARSVENPSPRVILGAFLLYVFVFILCVFQLLYLFFTEVF
jgi:hypothetical protein